MPLPVTFGNLTAAVTGDLDLNFAAVGALGLLPCTVSGTNTLLLTANPNTPTVSAYADYLSFLGVASATNTGPVTVRLGSLAALPVYRDSAFGPELLSGSEIVAGNAFVLTYDSALTQGGGGFHLLTGSATDASVGYTVSALPTPSMARRGFRSYVTDASTTTASVGGAITGGGANVLPVFCTGTAWVYG